MPTREEIETARTPNGGYTKAQLAEWGVAWPPTKGWKRAITTDAAGGGKTFELDPQAPGAPRDSQRRGDGFAGAGSGFRVEPFPSPAALDFAQERERGPQAS